MTTLPTTTLSAGAGGRLHAHLHRVVHVPRPVLPAERDPERCGGERVLFRGGGGVLLLHVPAVQRAAGGHERPVQRVCAEQGHAMFDDEKSAGRPLLS